MTTCDKRSEERRESEGQELITYDHIKSLLEHESFKITRKQQLIKRALLLDDAAENLKVQR